jgi:hypothetical protein
MLARELMVTTIRVTKSWKDGAWNRLFNGYKTFITEGIADATKDLVYDAIYGAGINYGLNVSGSILPYFSVEKVSNKELALDFGSANNFVEAVEEGTNTTHWVPRIWIENKEWYPHGTRMDVPKRTDGKSRFALLTPQPGRHFIAQGMQDVRDLLPTIIDKGLNVKRQEAGL